MIDGFIEDDFLDWNYDFFRVHRVIPAIGSKARRQGFKLKDLQVASLQNKRKSRFEENINKKKSKEEDQAFYHHKSKQGGSAFD